MAIINKLPIDGAPIYIVPKLNMLVSIIYNDTAVLLDVGASIDTIIPEDSGGRG